MSLRKIIVLGVLAFGMATGAMAADRPYSDGSVVVISNVRTKPGKFEDYMKYLSTTYKTLMEAYKKEGLITGYSIYAAQPRTPHDPNLILTVVYPNMAALDKNKERDAIQEKVMGGMDAVEKAAAARSDMREQLGSETVRQLVLK